MGNTCVFFINIRMLLFEIFGKTIPHNPCTSDLLDQHIDLIRESCGDFLSQSQDLPLYKSINQYTPFVKLKARIRKQNNAFSTVFNETFNMSKLRQRAIYAHGQTTEEQSSQFYLFPTNGFKFLYNPQVTDSSIYERVYKQTSDEQLVSQLLIENYHDTDLPTAIESGSEILFFNTPFCYAVNTQSVACYNELLTLINRS